MCVLFYVVDIPELATVCIYICVCVYVIFISLLTRSRITKIHI